MFQSLPQGIKVSISRSIKKTFENYMADIGWDEQKFSFDQFVHDWKTYSQQNASWYHKIDEETKLNERFHQELTEKISEVIEKVLTTPPSEAEMEQIEQLVTELGLADVHYGCKAEAAYHIHRLQETKKKSLTDQPASEKQVKMASIVYYQAYEKDLPDQPYTSDMIQDIIRTAKQQLHYIEDNGDEMNYPIQ